MTQSMTRWRRVFLALVLCSVLVVGGRLVLTWLIGHAINLQLLGHASWSGVDISPGALRFADVELFDEAGEPVLRAPEIRVSYSLPTLLRRRLFVLATDRVVVVRPRLEARIYPNGTLNLQAVLRPSVGGDLFRGTVDISEGEVVYSDERAPRFVASFRNVNVHMDTTHEQARATLACDQIPAPSQEAVVRVDATWKQRFTDVHSNVRVHGLDAAVWANYALQRLRETRLRLTSGVGNANLLVVSHGPVWNGLDVSGDLGLEHVEGVLLPSQGAPRGLRLPIREGRLNAVLMRDMIDIKRFHADLAGDKLEVTGRVFDVHRLQLDLSTRFKSRNVAATMSHLGVKSTVPVRGRGETTVRILGAVAAPKMSVQVDFPVLVIAGRALRTVKGTVAGTGGTWHIEHLRARESGGSLEANGWVFGGNPPRMVIHMHTRDAKLSELVGDVLGAHATASAHLTILGTRAHPIVIGNARLNAVMTPSLPLSNAVGSFVYQDRGVMFSNVHAGTPYGTLEAPFGFVDLARRRLLAELRGGISIDTPRARLRDARLAMIVTGTARRLLAVGRVKAAGLTSESLALHNIDANVGMSPDFLWLSNANFLLDGRRASASAALSRLDRTFDIRAWSRSVEPASLMAAIGLGRQRAGRGSPAPGAGPFTLQATGTADNAAFRLALNAASGRYDANGVVDKRGIRGSVVVENLDAKMLTLFGLDDWYPRGRLDLAALYGVGRSEVGVEMAGLSRTFSIGGLPFDRFVYASTSSSRGTDVHDATLLGPVGLVSFDGRIPSRGGSWRVNWQSGIRDLHSVARHLRVGKNPAHLREAFKSWRLDSLRGHAFVNGDVRGPKDSPDVTGKIDIADARLHGDSLTARVSFLERRNTVTVREGLVTLGGDPVKVRGTVGTTANPRVNLFLSTQHMDLARVLGFTQYNGVSSAGWLDADLHCTGTTTGPAAAGRVHLHAVRVNGQRIDDADIRLSAAHGSMIVQQLLARLGGGTVTGKGTISVDGPLRLELAAQHFPLREVAVLHGTPLAEGQGDFKVSIRGTASNPGIVADVDVTGLSVDGTRAQVSVLGRLSWNRPRLSVQNLTVSAGNPGGSASASGFLDFPHGRFPRAFNDVLAGTGDVDVSLRDADVANLLAFTHQPGASGRLSGSVAIRGKLSQSLISGSVTGTSVHLGGVEVGTLQASGSYNAGSGRFGNFDLSTRGTGGELDVIRRGQDENRLSLRARGFFVEALQPLMPWRFPVRGRLDAAFEVSGPLLNPDVNGAFSVADGRIAGLAFDSFSGSVVATNGLYRLNDFVVATGPHRAILSGVVPLRWDGHSFVSHEPIDVSASLVEKDLNVLSLFIPDMLTSPGTLRARLDLYGRYPDVRWDGELSINNGSFRHRMLRQPLDNLTVAATLRGNRLKIGRFTGNLGSGLLTASGGADVEAFRLQNMDFRLLGKELTVIAPPYLSAVLDADLRLHGSSMDPYLDGTVNARRARVVVPLIDLGRSEETHSGRAGTKQEALRVAPHGNEGTSKAPHGETGAGAPFAAPPLTFSIDVDLGSDAWLSFLGNLLRAEGRVAFVGKGSDVVPRGRVALRQGQIQVPLIPVSMRLTGGHASFDNGWIPSLAASAVTTVGGYDIYVDVNGPANSPDVALSSNPPLPQTAIRELLLRGMARQPGQLGLNTPGVYGATSTLDIGALMNVAEATFLRPVTSFIGRLFGVSEVTFEFVQLGGVQFTLYRALDARQKFFLTFSSLQGAASLNLPRQVYGIEYRFSPSQLVRLSSDNLGGLHIFYQSRWRF